MGNILRSRKRPPSEELDELVLQIRELEAQLKQMLADRASILRWLNCFTLFLVAVLSSLGWFQHGSVRRRLLSVAFVCLCAGLLFCLVRRLIGSAFGWLIARKRNRIALFTETKLAIIERVKENEKYNVAMELIKKYGDEEMEKNKNGSKNGHTAARRRGSKDSDCVDQQLATTTTTATASPSATALATPAPSSAKMLPKLYEMADNTAAIVNFGTNAAAGGTAAALRRPPPSVMALTIGGKSTPTPYHPHGHSSSHRTPIRPFIEQSRTPVDRVLDFLMGESINSRYALICSHCHTHNGMALLEEFKSLSFFCYKCNTFNASKNELAMLSKKSAPVPAASEATGETEENGGEEDEKKEGEEEEGAKGRKND